MDTSNTVVDCPGGSVDAATSLDSRVLHVILWILAIFSILGNTIVLVWRLCRPRAGRYSVGSLLILSLAAFYMFYGCHELLLEVSLLCPVFDNCGTVENSTSSCGLCESSYWLSACSSVLATWMTLGVMIYTFTFTVPRFNVPGLHKVLVWVFLVGNGVFICLIAVPAMAGRFYDYGIIDTCCNSREHQMSDSRQLVALIVTQCTSSTTNQVPRSLPAFIAFTNTLLTAVCSIVLIATVYRLASSGQLLMCTHQTDSQEVRTRYLVVVVSSILCWWPAFVLHILYVLGKRDSFSDLAAVSLVAMALPPFLHPIVYLGPLEACTYVRRLWRCRCNLTSRNQSYEVLLAGDQRQCGRCCCFMCTETLQ